MGNHYNSAKANESLKPPTPENIGCFGIHGDSIELSGEYNETMRMSESPDYQQCVYGSKWHSSHNNKDIITYRLQINQQRGSIGIGLITNDQITNQCFEELPTKIGAYYGIWSGGDENIGYKQTNRPQGSRMMAPTDIHWGFGTNSLIYITLDLSTKQIVFQRHSYKPSIWSTETKFDNIWTGDNIEYKLVISVENSSDSVTILEYEQHKVIHNDNNHEDRVQNERKYPLKSCINDQPKPRLCESKLPPPPPRNPCNIPYQKVECESSEEESLHLFDVDSIIESRTYERRSCVFQNDQQSPNNTQRESAKSIDESFFDAMSSFKEQFGASEREPILLCESYNIAHIMDQIGSFAASSSIDT